MLKLRNGLILRKVNRQLFTPHITSVQYCGGCSVHWRLFSTLEVVQYIGGITSVLWGDSFSTVEVVQYSGG